MSLTQRMLYIEEPNNDQLLDIGKIKALTGGESFPTGFLSLTDFFREQDKINKIKREYKQLYIPPNAGYSYASKLWLTDIYSFIRIEWLGSESKDAHNLWLASPHMKFYPDFKPNISDKVTYIMWSLRQLPLELSFTSYEIQFCEQKISLNNNK